MRHKILVTGGAGFIGTHTVIELVNAGHEVVVVDNLINSNKKSIEIVEKIVGQNIPFYIADVCDEEKLLEIFMKEKPTGVIHFAALKAVGESTEIPLAYYKNNITGVLTLLKVMEEVNCKNIIFSSSATVYGDPHTVPILEDFPLSVTNPYGRTKLMTEEILTDIYKADVSWNVVILRYFNPIGAHGTGVRDYIHVVDLARGHVAALQKLEGKSGLSIYNLGTGKGYSVLEIIKNMEKAVGKKIPFDITERRAGDIASCYADSKRAKDELGWEAKFDIERMCQDAWRWQSKHPNGFED